MDNLAGAHTGDEGLKRRNRKHHWEIYDAFDRLTVIFQLIHWDSPPSARCKLPKTKGGTSWPGEAWQINKILWKESQTIKETGYREKKEKGSWMVLATNLKTVLEKQSCQFRLTLFHLKDAFVKSHCSPPTTSAASLVFSPMEFCYPPAPL